MDNKNFAELCSAGKGRKRYEIIEHNIHIVKMNDEAYDIVILENEEGEEFFASAIACEARIPFFHEDLSNEQIELSEEFEDADDKQNWSEYYDDVIAYYLSDEEAKKYLDEFDRDCAEFVDNICYYVTKEENKEFKKKYKNCKVVYTSHYIPFRDEAVYDEDVRYLVINTKDFDDEVFREILEKYENLEFHRLDAVNCYQAKRSLTRYYIADCANCSNQLKYQIVNCSDYVTIDYKKEAKDIDC